MTTETDIWNAIIEDVSRLHPEVVHHNRVEVMADLAIRRDSLTPIEFSAHAAPLSEAYNHAVFTCFSLRKAYDSGINGMFGLYRESLELAYELRGWLFIRDCK